MDRIHQLLRQYPSQEKVAMVMLRHGISVRGGKAYCGPIEQSDAAIARAADVDHRVVRSAITRIDTTPGLSAIFSKVRPTLLMSDMAPEIGCSTIEIIPTDASKPGILAETMGVIYKQGLTVRQAVIDDPGNRMESHLIVVVDGEIPAYVIPLIKGCSGVASVIIR
jgi:uncharacterized protein